MSVFDGDGDNNTAPLLEVTPGLAQFVRNVRGRDTPRKLHLLRRLTAPCTLFHRTPHLTVPRVDLRAGRDANDRPRGRRDEFYNAALALRLRRPGMRGKELFEGVFPGREFVRGRVEEVDVGKGDLAVGWAAGELGWGVVALGWAGDVQGRGGGFKAASGGWGSGVGGQDTELGFGGDGTV